jgi:hypothetical protein
MAPPEVFLLRRRIPSGAGFRGLPAGLRSSGSLVLSAQTMYATCGTDDHMQSLTIEAVTPRILPLRFETRCQGSVLSCA